MSEISETKSKERIKVKTVVFRILLVFFTLIFLLVGGLFCGVWIFEFGPSEKARDLFVVSMMETSAAKFLATSFLGEEKVNEILEANSLKAVSGISDSNLVVINPNGNKNPSGSNDDPSGQKPTIPGSDGQEIDPDGDGIDVVDVKGSTFKGKMMIVYDPTRVFVGVSGPFGPDESGRPITDIYHSYDNVVAGINGGGWYDPNGLGSGGQPLGIVISNGEVLWGTPMSSSWECCGITEEGKLIVGTFTVQEAVDMGIVNALKYGPTLIVDNVPTESLGAGSGLNPRTAIGQRADGAILLLAVEGRHSDSMGASYVDMQDVMLKFEAVNAYNLDGGNSTTMIYNDELIVKNGFRNMCTTFLVRGQTDEQN